MKISLGYATNKHPRIPEESGSLYSLQSLDRLVMRSAMFFSHFFCLWCLSAEVQAIASLIEKQAQIVVKQKEVTVEEKRQKQALLEQYANVTDEEEYPFCVSGGLFYFKTIQNLFLYV